MDRRFKKIEMSNVREIIAKRGFYYLPLSRVYDTFDGCKYIIVTDNSDFSEQNPEFAKEIIMTPEEFEPYAEADLKISNYNWNPVENRVFNNLQNEKLYHALEQLTETQRKRVIMFYIYGWTERQIAEHEGVKRYAVRTSLNSARKKLKKFL